MVAWSDPAEPRSGIFQQALRPGPTLAVPIVQRQPRRRSNLAIRRLDTELKHLPGRSVPLECHLPLVLLEQLGWDRRNRHALDFAFWRTASRFGTRAPRTDIPPTSKHWLGSGRRRGFLVVGTRKGRRRHAPSLGPVQRVRIYQTRGRVEEWRTRLEGCKRAMNRDLALCLARVVRRMRRRGVPQTASRRTRHVPELAI